MEKKLVILKSILDSNLFGYTLMELYNKFRETHGIGSRNTLKKYLGILVDREQIRIRVIGNYKVFRSNNPFTTKTLFELYPQIEKFSIDFLSAITKVLGEDIERKGKAIGRELARTLPLLESKAIQQFKQFKPFFKLIPFKKFLQSLREKTILEFEEDIESKIKENEAFLIFRDTKLLKEGGWIHYYILAGIIEFHLNEIFSQMIEVNVESINEDECTIKFEKRRS